MNAMKTPEILAMEARNAEFKCVNYLYQMLLLD